MTVEQLRNFCNKKPANMGWFEFDTLEVSIMTEFGMEFISEFEEGSGVTLMRPDIEDGEEDKYVFTLLTEDFEDELHSPDCMDMRISAEDELRMYNMEDIANNLN